MTRSIGSLSRQLVLSLIAIAKDEERRTRIAIALDEGVINWREAQELRRGVDPA